MSGDFTTEYRRPTHSGSWYTADSKSLDAQLSGWLSRADKHPGTARALIAPHAGYSYSGACAAFAYKQIEADKVKRIFVLGPSHHVYIKGCALTKTSRYGTPLSDLLVDKATNEELFNTGHFEWMNIQTDEDEHSIEMQLPYVAKVMSSMKGRYTVVPILVGTLSNEKQRQYGDILAKYLADPENLFIISSDFCHWGKRFSYTYYNSSDGRIYECIEKLDRQGMDLIERLDTEGFQNYLKTYKNTICGRFPISVLLSTIDAMKEKGLNGHRMTLKFHHYSQSSPCMSLNDSSVSYAAASLSFI